MDLPVHHVPLWARIAIDPVQFPTVGRGEPHVDQGEGPFLLLIKHLHETGEADDVPFPQTFAECGERLSDPLKFRGQEGPIETPWEISSR